jgi:hypothetical protein
MPLDFEYPCTPCVHGYRVFKGTAGSPQVHFGTSTYDLYPRAIDEFKEWTA